MIFAWMLGYIVVGAILSAIAERLEFFSSQIREEPTDQDRACFAFFWPVLTVFCFFFGMIVIVAKLQILLGKLIGWMARPRPRKPDLGYSRPPVCAKTAHTEM